jgi:hypothetical protein
MKEEKKVKVKLKDTLKSKIKAIKTKIVKFFKFIWHSDKISIKNFIVNILFVNTLFFVKAFKFFIFLSVLSAVFATVVFVFNTIISQTVLKSLHYISYSIASLVVVCTIVSMWDEIVKYIKKDKI